MKKLIALFLITSILAGSLFSDDFLDELEKEESKLIELKMKTEDKKKTLDPILNENLNEVSIVSEETKENKEVEAINEKIKIINKEIKKEVLNIKGKIDKIEVINKAELKKIKSKYKQILKDLDKKEIKNGELKKEIQSLLTVQLLSIESKINNNTKKMNEIIKLKTENKNLKNLYKNLKNEFSEFKKYVKSELSKKTKVVEEKSIYTEKNIDLTKDLLKAEFFPIKYVKNFYSKEDITVVLNNAKEYKINSMITNRCRVLDMSKDKISIECIDFNNEIYTNTMMLEIVDKEEDFIYNKLKKNRENNNGNF